MKHILIDYENIQPDNLNEYDPAQSHIWLFVGKSQATLPITFIQSLLMFKQHIDLIQISQIGKNALDFHLAYYLGKITERDSQAEIVIISNDKGYDPLIEYVRQEGICQSIQRESNISSLLIGVTQPELVGYSDELTRLNGIKETIRKIAKDKRPEKKGGLMEILKQLGCVDNDEVQHYISLFTQAGWISINSKNKITYYF